MKKRLILPIAGLLASGFLVGACGSAGPSSAPVASVSSSASAPASSTGSSTGSVGASPLAYSRCMRGHGISDFPDPSADGGLRLEGHPGSDTDPNNPRYKAADSACKALLPPRTPPKNLKAQNLKFARCMRGHGIADFPDPKADGSLQLQATQGSDLDPTNPRFKAANDACKKYAPGGSGAGGFSTSGAS